MNRKVLIELLKSGMRYRPGRHQFWVSRRFEITVRRNGIVELDEYEHYSTMAAHREGMFHIGRSILHLKDKRVIEEPGSGWPSSTLKVNGSGKK